MKISLVIFASLLLISSASDQITWTETEHDFGDINATDYVEHDFTFVNSSDEPIAIENIRVTCGCTTPFYTEAPVMPGDTGRVAIRYNPKGRTGYFRKTISVFFEGIKGKHKLRIAGTIIEQ